MCLPKQPDWGSLDAGPGDPTAGEAGTRSGSDALKYGGLGLAGLGLFLGTGAAYDKAKADKLAYATQAAVERNSAAVDELRAGDATTRGQDQAFAIGLKASQVEGAQRARMAAGGADLNEGSALHILDDTHYMAHLDMATAGDNAAKEAWALRESAKMKRSNADLYDARSAAESPLRSAASTFLTGAGSVASSWYKILRPSAAV